MVTLASVGFGVSHHNRGMTFVPASGWTHSLAALGSAFYAPVAPMPLSNPYWVGQSAEVAQLLGFPPDWQNDPDALPAFTGNRLLDGTQTLASVYSGHQFGHWAGQLGDGRAILLGELKGQEIQLKGAGATPFSRRGDGRAVLRSSIREFLGSEAMHALGIPTTRALCITGSDDSVYRERVETAAVVTRTAPSFIRFGHFEHFSHHDLHGELRQLTDYVMNRYYPECDSVADFLRAVVERSAQMVAQWQAVGFCHGVLNTDNMSILGLTLDYGPFQFMDGFNPHHICNHSDTQGRYAFARQPQVVYWNLYALAQALLPLIGSESATITALNAFRPAFTTRFSACMAAKLGFAEVPPEQQHKVNTLVDELLTALASERVDYTIFWRRLSQENPDAAVRKLWVNPAGIAQFLLQYKELLTPNPRAYSLDLMQKTNPQYILRNHLGESAIRAAQSKDFSVLAHLQKVLQTPFDEHPESESFADFPPDWANSIAISCSS